MRVIRHVRARPEQAAELAAQLRGSDRLEALALGVSVEDALASSIVLSRGRSWVSYIDDQVAAVWGVVACDLLTGRIAPWMVSTPVVAKYPRAFFVESRVVLQGLLDTYGELSAWVDARYDMAVRWLRRLGFHMDGPHPYGPSGTPFYYATRKGRHGI